MTFGQILVEAMANMKGAIDTNLRRQCQLRDQCSRGHRTQNRQRPPQRQRRGGSAATLRIAEDAWS